MCFEIKAIADLCSICQDDRGTGPNGEPAPRTAFAAVDAEKNAHFGEKSGISIRELTVDIAREYLKPLADEEIYPLFPDDGSLTQGPDDATGYCIKRTAWPTYLDFRGHDLLPRLMLQEARTMETLSHHPHPHIIRYYGCRVKRHRITGLVLETFAFTRHLGFAKIRPDLFKGILDKHRAMVGVKSALDYLHTLGLAHNDVNPANVMFGDRGEPKLIDFGSCQPLGDHLMLAGTAGWCRERSFTSDKANDEYSLQLVGPWLDALVGEVRDSVSKTANWRMDVKDVPPASRHRDTEG